MKSNYNEKLDHHSENYTGIQGTYRGMDYNDYKFEEALDKLEEE